MVNKYLWKSCYYWLWSISKVWIEKMHSLWLSRITWKYGLRNHNQRYKCLACNKYFTGGEYLNPEEIRKELRVGCKKLQPFLLNKKLFIILGINWSLTWICVSLLILNLRELILYIIIDILYVSLHSFLEKLYATAKDYKVYY